MPNKRAIELIEDQYAETVITEKLNEILKDFNNAVEYLEGEKAIILGLKNEGDNADQVLIDFAFSFYLAGLISTVDSDSNFNNGFAVKRTKKDEMN